MTLFTQPCCRLQINAYLEQLQAQVASLRSELQAQVATLDQQIQRPFCLTQDSDRMAFSDGSRLCWTFSPSNMTDPMLQIPGASGLCPLQEKHWNAVFAASSTEMLIQLAPYSNLSGCPPIVYGHPVTLKCVVETVRMSIGTLKLGVVPGTRYIHGHEQKFRLDGFKERLDNLTGRLLFDMNCTMFPYH